MFLKEVEKPSYCVCSKENEACKVGDLVFFRPYGFVKPAIKSLVAMSCTYLVMPGTTGQ